MILDVSRARFSDSFKNKYITYMVIDIYKMLKKIA